MRRDGDVGESVCMGNRVEVSWPCLVTEGGGGDGDGEGFAMSVCVCRLLESVM